MQLNLDILRFLLNEFMFITSAKFTYPSSVSKECIPDSLQLRITAVKSYTGSRRKVIQHIFHMVSCGKHAHKYIYVCLLQCRALWMWRSITTIFGLVWSSPFLVLTIRTSHHKGHVAMHTNLIIV